METKSTTFTTSKPLREFTGDAQHVREVLEELREAVLARDVDGILEFYDEDARLFDIRDTLEHRDLDSYRAYWDECFRGSKDYSYNLHDVQIDISGDLAVCTMLNNARGTDVEGKTIEAWTRMTEVLRKTGETWKIEHEHVSCPGDFLHMKLLDNLKPGDEINRDQHKH